jgi:hypothetical protein
MNRKDLDTGSTTLDLSLGDERNTPKEKQCRNANLETATWKYRRSDAASHSSIPQKCTVHSYLDERSDLPEQYRAIGWVGEQMYTVIFEVREDEEGEYYHLVTLWKATKQEQQLYAEHS